MSPDPSRRFSCETYLLAFAGGAREGLVREHIEHCYFCRDIVHGGTEEFPLSYDEEVAQRRAELRRANRRRFLKVGAAAVVGLATLGTTGVIASRYLFHPTQVIEHKRHKALDKIFSLQGRPGVIAYLDQASIEERVDAHTWIAERGHLSLVDLIVIDIASESKVIRAGVVMELRKFDPAQLAPWKTTLANAQAIEPAAGIAAALGSLVDSIP